MGFDKAALLARQSPKESYTLENGDLLHFRVMSAGDRVPLADIFLSKGDKANAEDQFLFKARLLIASACDENGEPVFAAEDVDALRQIEAPLFDKIAAVAMRVNGFGGDAEKNSGAATSGASPSA